MEDDLQGGGGELWVCLFAFRADSTGLHLGQTRAMDTRVKARVKERAAVSKGIKLKNKPS